MGEYTLRRAFWQNILESAGIMNNIHACKEILRVTDEKTMGNGKELPPFRMGSSYWASRGSVGPEWEFQPEPLKDMVIYINIGPDGYLWARRGTTETPFFDIFDPTNGELLRQAIFIDDGYSWKFEITRNGILAWEEDPEDCYQVLYQIQKQLI